ncbi:MAG: ribosome maturation factor RimM [Methylomicrobium sp.]
MTDRQFIDVGEISGIFGVKGWVKVYSYTDPRENILSYSSWRLSKGVDVMTLNVLDGKLQGKSVVARLQGVEDRDAAAALMGWSIAIDRAQLPKLESDEFYWVDLVGLRVVTAMGIELGVVDHLIETGANDVLVVNGERERLIPFLMGQTVLNVDLTNRCLTVDWDSDF